MFRCLQKDVKKREKRLCYNIPVKKAINKALRSLCAIGNKVDIPRATMERFLELAVTKVHLKCNESWYCQIHGMSNIAF